MEKFIEYFWIFIIGSFLGFICETIWCIIRWKKIESRKGLIYGHLIPIYGIASLIISLIIYSLNIKNYFLFFIITFLICAIVEYISSFCQEKCFGTKSWDYSEMIGNLHGRINILYLLIWSIMGIFWCKYYKKIINIIIIPLKNLSIISEITILFFIFTLYNCFISICAAYRQKLRRKNIAPKNNFEIWLDKRFNDERLNKIYANAKVVK